MPEPRSSRGVVVGIDGSGSSLAALRWAAHDSELRRAPLTVVYVASEVPELSAGDLTRLVDETVGPAKEIRIECPTGRPVPQLVEFSAHADRVVVGRFGHTEGPHRMIGSVGAALLRHAHCPVVIVHDDAPGESGHRPVLVGIDGSRTSAVAVEIAFDEASRRGVGLLALHVCKEVDPHNPDDRRAEEIQLDAEQLLIESSAVLQERFPGVAVHPLVRFQNPARQILVQSERAQLVVLGSHGRGGMAGLLLGSVSSRVADECRKPVLVARRH
jgi:nucleotide-binding universal stress UspA family protein